MSKLKWFPAVLLSLAGVVLPAQQLETKPADPAAAFRDEAYVVEQLRAVVRFENDGTGRREHTARIRVLSEAGVEQLGQLIVGYNSGNERIEIAYVRVRRDDGTVVESQPADAIQDMSWPGGPGRLPCTPITGKSTLPCPVCVPAQILEYQSQQPSSQTPLAPGQFWMEHEFAPQTPSCWMSSWN